MAQAITNNFAVPHFSSLLELIKFLIARAPEVTLEELTRELDNVPSPSCIILSREIRSFGLHEEAGIAQLHPTLDVSSLETAIP